jgi:hypothetical protein
VGDTDLNFRDALATRLRRAGVAYAAMMLFYFFDVSSTVAILSTGRFAEATPINRGLLDSGGTVEWIAFRLATFAGVTILVAVAFSLTAAILSVRAPGKGATIDVLEDGVLGTTIMFYSLTLLHNLVTVAPVLAQAA